MDKNGLARIAVALLLLTVVGSSSASAVEPTNPSNCLVHHYAVYRSSENVSDVQNQNHIRFANMSKNEQRVFKNGLESEGGSIRISDREWRTIRDVPRVIVYDGAVYRTTTGHAWCTTSAKAYYYLTKPSILATLGVIVVALAYVVWKRRETGLID